MNAAQKLAEAIASLRHIALNGCRCSDEDDLLQQSCNCDAARVAQLTLEQMGVTLVP